MIFSPKRKHRGLTLIELMVALGVIAVATIAMTQSMLILNRASSLSRVRNLAKAMALGRIQEVGALPYDPSANPAIVPSILAVGTTTETVDLGDASTGMGKVPATLTWTVASAGSNNILSINCRLDYTYLSRPQNYEVLTFRAPD